MIINITVGGVKKMVSKKIYNRRKLSEDNYNGNNKIIVLHFTMNHIYYNLI